MGTILNIDLLTVGIAVAGNILLGFSVFSVNRKSATNILFFLQTLILSIWGVTNYLSYQPHDANLALVVVRLVLFFATPNSIVFLILMHTFPSDKLKMSKKTLSVLVVITVSVMLITLSPLLFKEVIINESGAPTPVPGVGMIPFVIVSVLSIPLGIFYLIKNYLKARDEEKKQFVFLLIGVVIMFAAIILLAFIFPTVFHNTRFIPLSAFFTFPFVAFTFYAIYKHHLFNIRAALIAALTFVLCVAAFIEILFSDTVPLRLLRSGVFLLVLAISIFMNKAVATIAEQREELSVANEQQANLISFITHQVKGFFTKSRNIFSGILEGDYGLPPDLIRTAANEGFISGTKGVEMVQEVLSASNIRKGTIQYNMEPMDLKDLINEIMTELKPNAAAKNLLVNINIPEGDWKITADKGQLKQAFKNIIDNSIKYTLTGNVTVSLLKKNDKILFSEKDTGVGITEEDKVRLFTEGGKGKDSLKVNVDSTGFGLFIVKKIIEAHKGRVWAESAGKDKGSQFYIELPVS